MLAILADVFDALYTYKREDTPENLAKLREIAAYLCQEAKNAPPKGKAKAIAERFIENSDNYIRFAFNPKKIEPTNNAAEQVIRSFVVNRRLTQGTRGLPGIKASMVYWSVKMTCEVQHRSFNEYFKQCYEAYCKGEKAPSILPTNTSQI
jgi:hypothetical protein